MFKKSTLSRKYTKLILMLLMIVITIIISFNIFTSSFIKTKENIAIAQMIPGWGRQYKPIMHDNLKPDAVAFGASWVRDAFDPVLSENIINLSFFNHGVSGATSYETKRFVESAAQNKNLKHAYLNVESFYDNKEGIKKQHGFEESILNIDTNGDINKYVQINRLKNKFTTGASLAYNFRLIMAKIRLENGENIGAISPSYQSIDWSHHKPDLEKLNQQIFTTKTFEIEQKIKNSTFYNLISSIKTLCKKNINVHVYETPHHALFKGCNSKYNNTLQIRKLLDPLRELCSDKLSYHSFLYPNSITLDGRKGDKKMSKFYRPDGHPTPYIGIHILRKIHNKNNNRVDTLEDFGSDLMKLSIDKSFKWIERKKNRCGGKWVEEDIQTLKKDEQRLID
tara:strand:+ start:2138 stop:3322 length:1185 start_codon:yes stop_codon:yes gene_type:complete